MATTHAHRVSCSAGKGTKRKQLCPGMCAQKSHGQLLQATSCLIELMSQDDRIVCAGTGEHGGIGKKKMFRAAKSRIQNGAYTAAQPSYVLHRPIPWVECCALPVIGVGYILGARGKVGARLARSVDVDMIHSSTKTCTPYCTIRFMLFGL